jgi:hypothetical protein
MSWIGCDLDGTLAHYTSWGTGEIGEPIPEMMQRVKEWIANGKTVKIFTARASNPHELIRTKVWLAKHGLGDLEVTNVKDFAMIELWDDRCVQVIPNTGQPVSHESIAILHERRVK